jgi:hypothetical protein
VESATALRRCRDDQGDGDAATLDTCIQNNAGTDKNASGGSGCCINCHTFVKLPADKKTSANFSFLPGLAEPDTARDVIMTPP